MKNKIKIFAVFILLMTEMVSCGKWITEIFGEDLSTYDGVWSIKNNTDKAVYLRISDNPDFLSTDIQPEETVRLNRFGFKLQEDYSFYKYQEQYPDYNPFYLYLKEGDVLLYTWTIEGKDDPGKQFFNESSWTVETIRDGRERIWTFEINPEDIP